MKLVKLTARNKNTLLRISEICFGKDYTDKETKKWYEKRLDGSYKEYDSVLEYFLAKERGKPVGITGFFKSYEDENFWLGYFGVIPKERRQGLGSTILNETIKLAKKRGAKSFALWGSSKRAEKFYIENGFSRMKPIKSIDDYKFPKGTYFYQKKI